VTYRLEVSRQVSKTISALDKSMRRRVLAAIENLADDPRPPGVKKLQGNHANTWRIRIGDWRVIYEIYDDILVVIVVDVDHRGSMYR